MANPHRGEVALEADGQTYTLSFSVNAICELEEVLDKPIGQIMGALQGDGVSMKTVRWLVWAGLQDHHEDVDEKKAGRIATEIGVTETLSQVGKALKLAFPDAEAKDSDRPRKARSQARSTS